MHYRVYSGPKGSADVSPLEKSQLLFKEFALLDDALAHIECRRVASHSAGDHTVIIGEVETAAAHSHRPLLYYRGGYAQLER